jgi:SAM-dependent methyltransferase
VSDWGQGYQVEIPYTLGFYPELAPAHLEAALLFSGFKVDLARPGTTYCELGCGYGLTTLILAAANPQISFVGVDFNPSHIVAANALVEAAGLRNVRFVEASFDELLEPRFADLGAFDIITLHGIYSWVSPAIRRAIVDFADAKLKTGGVLYVSYNAAPGWMPRAPLQRLLFESAKRNPAADPRAATADAFRFAKAMKDAGSFYFTANPRVGAFIEAMEGKDLAYLVHEHLNESWSALYHADVVADFSRTRLTYACSGFISDDLDETSVPITTHDLLPGTSDNVWRETVKDFLVGRSFRRDIFVRGPQRLSASARLKALDRTYMLVVPRSAATQKIMTSLGAIEGRADLYSEVFDLLAAGPTTLAKLLARARGAAKDPAVLVQALALLTHSGQVKMVCSQADVDCTPAHRLNLALAHEIAAGKGFHTLAAPAIGTGISADLADFGYLLAREQGLRLEPATIAAAIWGAIEGTATRPKKGNQVFQQKSEALAYLTQAAQHLLSDKLDILKVLGI